MVNILRVETDFEAQSKIAVRGVIYEAEFNNQFFIALRAVNHTIPYHTTPCLPLLTTLTLGPLLLQIGLIGITSGQQHHAHTPFNPGGDSFAYSPQTITF